MNFHFISDYCMTKNRKMRTRTKTMLLFPFISFLHIWKSWKISGLVSVSARGRMVRKFFSVIFAQLHREEKMKALCIIFPMGLIWKKMKIALFYGCSITYIQPRKNMHLTCFEIFIVTTSFKWKIAVPLFKKSWILKLILILL